MRIISHRGYWHSPAEKNSLAAFERSFALGFGTETDIRDLGREIMVSHDSPSGAEMSLSGLLDLVSGYPTELTLALNVKADGLQSRTLDALKARNLRHYFLFDMSIPDSLQWIKHGAPVYMRHSEYEPEPALYPQAAGIWLDAFQSDWWSEEDVARHLDAGKCVCIVSPELHGRNHEAVWEMLDRSQVKAHPDLILCTDIPESARDLLNAKD